MKLIETHVAFLRGINVGGHHKLPMADLQIELKKLNLQNISTLLNSGNFLFESAEDNLENKVSKHLENAFGFPVPVIIRKYQMIREMLNSNPFRDVKITKGIRLYVSFLKEEAASDLPMPWESLDGSYAIIGKKNNAIYSVLDLSVSKTPKAMEALERFYGKEITTRNWNTIVRIVKKASTQDRR